jgi:hypothetical protein
MTMSLPCVFALSLALTAAGTATALADCGRASQQHATAVGEIGTQTRRYADCVSENENIRVCDPEYERIQSAKDVLEDVLKKLRSECR